MRIRAKKNALEDEMMLSPSANFLSNKHCFEPWESFLKTAKNYLVLSSTIYIVFLILSNLAVLLCIPQQKPK